jgi:hypothetical protein
MNSRFSGRSGFGSWLGNVPSGSKKLRTTSSCGSRSRIGGSIAPAIPLAASTTTFSGLIASASTNERHLSTKPGQTSWLLTEPRRLTSPKPASARSRTSSKPDSPPTGSAPRRTIFIPVYSFGLCEAVTQMPPSSASAPTA